MSEELQLLAMTLGKPESSQREIERAAELVRQRNHRRQMRIENDVEEGAGYGL